MRYWIPYPQGKTVEPGEWIEAERTADPLNDTAIVTSHGGLLRLAPGDRILIDKNEVVGIAELKRQWVFEVYAEIPDLVESIIDPESWPAARAKAEQLNRQLNAATETDAPDGGLVTRIATESRSWFDNLIGQHPDVFFYDILRRPDTQISWEAESDLQPWDIETVVVRERTP